MGAPMSRAVHGAMAQMIRMLIDELVATGAPLYVSADMIQRVGGPFWSPSATGVLDMTANVLFLLANREGLLALVAVITSLYPASTIALAQLFLGERLARHQVVGLALAGVAVVLIAGTG